jgi:hypothetical protein
MTRQLLYKHNSGALVSYHSSYFPEVLECRQQSRVASRNQRSRSRWIPILFGKSTTSWALRRPASEAASSRRLCERGSRSGRARRQSARLKSTTDPSLKPNARKTPTGRERQPARPGALGTSDGFGSSPPGGDISRQAPRPSFRFQEPSRARRFDGCPQTFGQRRHRCPVVHDPSSRPDPR